MARFLLTVGIVSNGGGSGHQVISMAKLALVVRLDAKTGKGREVEALLRSALPLVAAESGTRAWFALKMAPEIYGIFDTFDTESDRQAHLSGKVAAALMERASELLERPPVIEQVEILAAHESKPARDPAPKAPPPIKDPNPPDAEVNRPAPEIPKIGSRDAPGG